MSDLRTRIAAVLASEQYVNLLGNGYDQDDLLALADAVIAELGLRQQNRYGFHRCVTEWTLDRADRSYCMRCGIPHQPGVCRREDHT
jgi:hypothetical protein